MRESSLKTSSEFPFLTLDPIGLNQLLLVIGVALLLLTMQVMMVVIVMAVVGRRLGVGRDDVSGRPRRDLILQHRVNRRGQRSWRLRTGQRNGLLVIRRKHI